MTRRERLREIIFEADTPAGKVFGIGRQQAGPVLRVIEWRVTLLFPAEYLARLAEPSR